MKNLVLLTLLIFSSGLIAQQQIDNQLIVQLNKSSAIQRVLDTKHSGLIDYQQISKRQNIYSITCTDVAAATYLKSELEQKQQVRFVKNDMISELRYTPNDPRYGEQWNLQVIGAEEVWEITRGGTTFEGKEIVIAVIDEGFKYHEDLLDNIWVNKGEIANNGIDDDSNGYIDDYEGLNVETENDVHTSDDHGSQVASILGAKGDNASGMAGLNFDIKLMLISEAKSVSDIIKAYEYVIDQRRKFNNSNGEEGAFVVVTNFSAGISGQFGTDWPIWCDLYDDLGEIGVLSVSAVPNAAVNVDTDGDLPTTCQSPYLITTTNTTEFDGFSSSAGFGAMHVDIGAPGEDVLVTKNEDEYRFGSGTSFSCPLIAGAIGLMYSLPCPQIEQDIYTNPSKIATEIKSAILENVNAVPDLEGKSVSGGRLDLLQAITALQDVCDSTVGVIDLDVSLNSNYLVINYETPDFSEYTLDIIDLSGKLVYTRTISPPLFGSKSLTLNTTPQGIYNREYATFLPSGIYVAMLYNDNYVISQKFYQN